jgi:tryptophan-rich sensory protein
VTQTKVQTVYAAVGGRDGLLRLAHAWHTRVLKDDVVTMRSATVITRSTRNACRLLGEALVDPRPTPIAMATRAPSSACTAATGRTRNGSAGDRVLRLALEMSAARDERLRRAARLFCVATTTTMARYHDSADDVPAACASRSGPGTGSSEPQSLTALELTSTLRDQHCRSCIRLLDSLVGRCLRSLQRQWGVRVADAAGFYAELVRPRWSPPAWVFGPVWSVLYGLMAVSAWLVWRERRFAGARVALALFVVQLAANALWSWLFFTLHRGDLAFAEVLILWSFIVATIVSFQRINSLAAILLYPIWLGPPSLRR